MIISISKRNSAPGLTWRVYQGSGTDTVGGGFSKLSKLNRSICFWCCFKFNLSISRDSSVFVRVRGPRKNMTYMCVYVCVCLDGKAKFSVQLNRFVSINNSTGRINWIPLAIHENGKLSVPCHLLPPERYGHGMATRIRGAYFVHIRELMMHSLGYHYNIKTGPDSKL